jgi:hypothetical protein
MHQRQVQICTLCRQPVLPERRLPFEKITIRRQAMCPSCWQLVSPSTREQVWYQERWLEFIRALGKRWKSGHRNMPSSPIPEEQPKPKTLRVAELKE